MNDRNVRTWYEDGFLRGTYQTRDPDDPDDDGTPIWERFVEAEGPDDVKAMKRLRSLLSRAYDEWQNGEKYA